MNPTVKKYLYPSITLFLVLIVIGVFVVSAMFITRSIDAALISEQEDQTKELEVRMQAFEAAKHKLSIERVVDESLIESSTTPLIKESTTTTSTIEVKKEENKELLSIAVLNSTGISGKAGELSSLLKNEGFKIAYTGNAQKREQISLIQTKETSKKIFPQSLQLVQSIVETKYKTIESTLKPESEYDVVIIIGAN